MPKLSELGARRTVAIEYEGKTVNVTFRPSAINADWQERVRALTASDQAGYIVLLAEALLAWDILDDEGEALAPTVELMRKLPIDFLYSITEAILESLAPKGRNTKRSAAG